MSSIRVSGNTSGYYDLTVPDVAGQNTIPLDRVVTTDSNGSITLSSTTSSPSLQIERNDGSGNVAQAGFNVFGSSTNIQPRLAVGVGPAGSPPNADFFFTEDGKMGIGTSNPNKELTVNGNAHVGRNSSSIPNTSLASDLDFLQVGASTFIQAGADAQAFIKSNNYWNGSGTSYVNTSYGSTTVRLNENNDGKFQIETAPASGAGTVPRLIINNTGHITTPGNPAFRAYLSTEWTTIGAYVNSGWTNQYNRGNCFNQGTFTAPVDGVYNFTVAWDALSTQSQLNLDRNGSYAGGFRYEPTGRTDNSWETHSYSVQTQLNANDYVKLHLSGGSGSNPMHMGGNQWGFFAGYLVG
jgi:hypothetical protein